MDIKKAPISDLIQLSAEEIRSLGHKDSLLLERRLRKVTLQRLNRIESQDLSHMSYEAFTRYFKEDKYQRKDEVTLPSISIRKSSRQEIQHKIAQYQNFLGAKSSTVKGIKDIMRREEERIFQGKEGFKTEAERTRFWAAYKEFENQYAALLMPEGASERLQRFLGSSTFWREHDFTAEDLLKLVDQMENYHTIGAYSYNSADETEDYPTDSDFSYTKY